MRVLDPPKGTHIKPKHVNDRQHPRRACLFMCVCVPTRLDEEGEGGGLDPVQSEAGGERGEEPPTSTTTATLGVGLLRRPVCVCGWDETGSFRGQKWKSQKNAHTEQEQQEQQKRRWGDGRGRVLPWWRRRRRGRRGTGEGARRWWCWLPVVFLVMVGRVCVCVGKERKVGTEPKRKRGMEGTYKHM